MLSVSAEERDLIFRLAEKLTGCNIDTRREIFVHNVMRRAEYKKAASIRDYLISVSGDSQELPYLVSALTIHTTSWFREKPHFDWLEDFFKSPSCPYRNGYVSLLSVGCSTAQELYSFALILESMRREGVIHEYHLEGWDIDMIVLDKAEQGIYAGRELSSIPDRFHRLFKLNVIDSDDTKSTIEIDSAIMKRTKFRPMNIVSFPDGIIGGFDFVVCRNLLIYFRQAQVLAIVNKLLSLMKAEGHLILGLGEGVSTRQLEITSVGPTVYRKNIAQAPQLSPSRTFAVSPKSKSLVSKPKAILIGASTGGPEALANLLQNMPKGSAPIVVVQHISAEFMRSFGRHLSITSGLKLVLVDDTVPLESDSLYMTVGDSHLVLRESNGRLYVEVSNVEPRNGHRPSIDILFESAVPYAESLVGVLLTGMGKDGARGLLNLRAARAFTMSQDEKSSVVYGMPKEAQLLGASLFEGDPRALRQKLDELHSGRIAIQPTKAQISFLKAR